ncbi:unnamed protein product [Prunus brigantina]
MNSCGTVIQNFFNDDSDDDDLHQHRVAMAVQHHTFLLEQYARQSKHGGSVVGREYKNWKRDKHHKSLMEDYFCERPLYPPVDFCRLVDMRRELFYRILNDVVAYELYFTQKIDASSKEVQTWVVVRKDGEESVGDLEEEESRSKTKLEVAVAVAFAVEDTFFDSGYHGEEYDMRNEVQMH